MVYTACLGRPCVDLSSASLELCRLVFYILEKKKTVVLLLGVVYESVRSSRLIVQGVFILPESNKISLF